MARQSKKPAGKKSSGWGGPRANSGPKRAEVRVAVAEVNAAMMQKLTPILPRLLDNLIELADGKFEQVEIKYGALGEVIERKVSWAAPDRKANEYLIDRVLGRPVAKQELSGPDGGAIAVDFDRALETVYGDGEAAG